MLNPIYFILHDKEFGVHDENDRVISFFEYYLDVFYPFSLIDEVSVWIRYFPDQNAIFYKFYEKTPAIFRPLCVAVVKYDLITHSYMFVNDYLKTDVKIYSKSLYEILQIST